MMEQLIEEHYNRVWATNDGGLGFYDGSVTVELTSEMRQALVMFSNDHYTEDVPPELIRIDTEGVYFDAEIANVTSKMREQFYKHNGYYAYDKEIESWWSNRADR